MFSWDFARGIGKRANPPLTLAIDFEFVGMQSECRKWNRLLPVFFEMDVPGMMRLIHTEPTLFEDFHHPFRDGISFGWIMCANRHTDHVR